MTSSSSSSSLRSRDIFPKLDDLPVDDAARELSEEDGEEDFTYSYYESPCTFMASNEEFLPEQIDAFDVCDTSFYGGCLDEPPTDVDTDTSQYVSVEVAFDFELWHRRRANVTKTLQHLEPVMLDHVANALGLKDCPNPVRQRRRRGMEKDHDLTAEELDLLVGISSAPEDFRDEDFDDCIVPAGIEARGAVCKPSTGMMTVYLKNDPTLTTEKEASIAGGIKKLVRFGMSKNIYLGGNTRYLSFIGTRTGEGEFDSVRDPNPDGLQVAPEGTVGDPNRTAAIVGGISAFVLLAFIVFFVAGRKKEQQKLDQDFIDAIASSDVSGGSKQQNEEAQDVDPSQDGMKKHPNALQKKPTQPPIGEVVAHQFDPAVSNLDFGGVSTLRI